MVDFSLVVTSDSVYRGAKEDKITPMVRETLAREGHRLVYSTVAPNVHREIARSILEACRHSRIVVATGGTGISPRDITVDIVRSLSEREIPGFGEAHRRLSWESVGPRATLSRASAFILPGGCFVAVTPGNPDAVRVALEILLPIAGHIEEQLEGRSHA